MRNLHSEAVNASQDKYESQPSLQDDLASYQAEIDLFFNNLVDYRAHLTHKTSEAKFDSDYYKDIDEIEVVVISDWKMKILASKYREAQQGMPFQFACVCHLNLHFYSPHTYYCIP